MKALQSETFEAALFDLDGVLIDTEGTYTEFWDEMARRYHKPATFALDIKGTTLAKILQANFPPELHDGIERMIHDFENSMVFRLFNGVEHFLDELEAMSVPMAIVTSSDDKKMRALGLQLPALVNRMAVIIDGSMVTRSKPDPQGYLMAAERLGKDPQRCVVFEDSLQGLEAGRRAGCKVVGLATTNPRSKVAPLADVVIDTWLETSPSQLGFVEA